MSKTEGLGGGGETGSASPLSRMDIFMLIWTDDGGPEGSGPGALKGHSETF